MKKCIYCEQELSVDAAECTYCGKPQPDKRQHKVNPNFFSLEGRINRIKYFWAVLAIGAIASVVMIFWPSSTRVIMILTSIAVFFPVIKRLHDINKSGVFAFLMFFPVLNLILGLVLLFKKGTNGANQYGDTPLKS